MPPIRAAAADDRTPALMDAILHPVVLELVGASAPHLACVGRVWRSALSDPRNPAHAALWHDLCKARCRTHTFLKLPTQAVGRPPLCWQQFYTQRLHCRAEPAKACAAEFLRGVLSEAAAGGAGAPGVSAMSLEQMKAYLGERGVDYRGCIDKKDFRNLAASTAADEVAQQRQVQRQVSNARGALRQAMPDGGYAVDRALRAAFKRESAEEMRAALASGANPSGLSDGSLSGKSAVRSLVNRGTAGESLLGLLLRAGATRPAVTPLWA